MNDIYVDDLVISIGDRTVVGQVLPISESAGGLHPNTDVDVWAAGSGPRFSESGLVPVRWKSEHGATYEWWEAPEFLEVVRPALDRSQPAVHRT